MRFIADDLLINFDDKCTQRASGSLMNSRRSQVLFFRSRALIGRCVKRRLAPRRGYVAGGHGGSGTRIHRLLWGQLEPVATAGRLWTDELFYKT